LGLKPKKIKKEKRGTKKNVLRLLQAKEKEGEKEEVKNRENEI